MPVSDGDRRLAVVPAFDARPRGALQLLVDRLVEWRLAAAGMVALKGAAAVLPQGGVAGGLSRRDRLLLRHLPTALAALPGAACARLVRSLGERWVSVDVDRLDGFLAGVEGWTAVVPTGAPPAEVAAAIRRAMATRPGWVPAATRAVS